MRLAARVSQARRRAGGELRAAFECVVSHARGAAGPSHRTPRQPEDHAAPRFMDTHRRRRRDHGVHGQGQLGQGIKTALVQVAAEELVVEPRTIQLVTADTGRTPDERYTAGSQSMQDSATAIRHAAAQVRALLVGLAAGTLGVPAESLIIGNGSIRAPDGRPCRLWRARAAAVAPCAGAAGFAAARTQQPQRHWQAAAAHRHPTEGRRPASLCARSAAPWHGSCQGRSARRATARASAAPWMPASAEHARRAESRAGRALPCCHRRARVPGRRRCARSRVWLRGTRRRPCRYTPKPTPASSAALPGSSPSRTVPRPKPAPAQSKRLIGGRTRCMGRSVRHARWAVTRTT